MEDDLMRIFGGERMRSMMATLKVPEDMPIENRLISRSIESAQKKVEGNNFDIRKHLVEYDDVINKHRESIYGKRRRILELSENDEADSLSEIVFENIEREIEEVVSFHSSAEYIKDWNLDEIAQVTATIFPVEESLKDDIKGFTVDGDKLDKAKARTKMIEHLVDLAKKKYVEIAAMAKELGIDWTRLEKSVLIRSIDTLWIEHLEAMSSVRQGIGLRGYGQRDPLIEYKKEAYRLYNELNTSSIKKPFTRSIKSAMRTAKRSCANSTRQAFWTWLGISVLQLRAPAI
jgi:preprotein translocase subunit SecA